MGVNGLYLRVGNQYQRFISDFNIIIYKKRQEFSLLGIQSGDLGYHLSYKVSRSVSSLGCILISLMDSICLCLCWNIGLVKRNTCVIRKIRRTILGAGSKWNEHDDNFIFYIASIF